MLRHCHWSLLAAIALTACAPDPSGSTTSPPVQCAIDGTEAPTRLFLQQPGPNSMIVKWRGGADWLCAAAAGAPMKRVEASQVGEDRIVRLSDLDPDASYAYWAGGDVAAHPSFQTAPRSGELPASGAVRLWLLGDSGTATEIGRDGKPNHPDAAASVRDGFRSWYAQQNLDKPLDLMVLLGDNAYPAGTDAQWQGAFFDIYREELTETAVVPTIGNHEMGTGEFDVCLFVPMPACAAGPVKRAIGGGSQSADPDSYDSDGDGPDEGGLPYLDIFELPAEGQLGGVASGTEQYYSMDYGPVHLVSLDSQLSTQDSTQLNAMRDWLIEDLSANQLPWTVVIFHHPPYTKGENHDSDVEQREIDMRTTFAPVFEDHGVDVIFGGHAHNYERSWYLGGHYGLSTSFDATAHTELTEAGTPAFGTPDAPYPQVSASSGKDDKAVYTVAGSAGKADHESPCPEGQRMGCTLPDWLQHPAHRTFEPDGHEFRSHGIARLGSVLLEATGTRLDSRFIDANGEVLDHFVITR